MLIFNLNIFIKDAHLPPKFWILESRGHAGLNNKRVIILAKKRARK